MQDLTIAINETISDVISRLDGKEAQRKIQEIRQTISDLDDQLEEAIEMPRINR